MNRALVEQVVNAVLYEGYILYPYRASAKKNRQRFTFGRVYPKDYSQAQEGAEPCRMQTQCLFEGSESARLEITVRFLHPTARDIQSAEGRPAASLEAGGQLYQSWQEAVERTVALPAQTLADLAGRTITTPFAFPDFQGVEPIVDLQGTVVGQIVRRQERVFGKIELSVEPVVGSVFKITVRITNETPAQGIANEHLIVMRTFVSTHTILQVTGGQFLSMIDPPANLAEAAKACENIGAWPILVGDEAKGERDAMISSPIILYDYPKIAPESPGDLFDGGEIDEILTLRILTMTDEEKREMRNVDAQARRILERTEAMPGDQLLRMHGVMRNGNGNGHDSSLDEDFFNPAKRLREVSVGGVKLREGDRVRVQPKSRADVMDMAVAGKVAVIESIEEDAESKTHLALVLEDDPGRDLGLLRQPGHRFFYGVDEVEPVEAT